MCCTFMGIEPIEKNIKNHQYKLFKVLMNKPISKNQAETKVKQELHTKEYDGVFSLVYFFQKSCSSGETSFN